MASLFPARTDSELLDANRHFYDALWSDARLIEPERFNTWPLVRSLLAPAQRRLEVAPGLRPRLPIEDTQFIDISAPALAKLGARGGARSGAHHVGTAASGAVDGVRRFRRPSPPLRAGKTGGQAHATRVRGGVQCSGCNRNLRAWSTLGCGSCSTGARGRCGGTTA
jgi:hypothetical protein